MDTIVAVSTPLGRSGIGVVRLSGVNALKIGQKLVSDELFSPKPRHAILRKIYEPSSLDVLDEAVLTFYKSPFSFTGEDVLEISCHGSPVLLRKIVDAALHFDARLAEPGEFTLRAVTSGKLNLSQAEAVRDLIDAQTVSAVRQAARQLGGELSNQLQPLKDDLLNIIVVLESALEFVEDDLPDFAIENIKSKLFEINKSIAAMAETFRAGRLLREGLKVALVGRPNVGKSSLFNSLIGQDRAIVTEIPGTTRDSLRENLSVNGIPISLFDTAGVREATDQVESIGVERTHRTIADADFVVVILDGSLPLQLEDFEVLRATEENLRLIAINKSDLTVYTDSTTISANDKVVRISAKTGAGLDLLRKELIAPFASQDIENSGFLISDARHHDLLRRAQLEVMESLDLLAGKTSEEIVLVGLHNALRLLGEITGETTSEDVLTRIFSTFCIGK
ncbi:MAG TPA: tRNA uridine-5-carboxymethylaminomethyl(34) synthesis GTPase MnmE [Pyrinomonadaceae bacterium]